MKIEKAVMLIQTKPISVLSSAQILNMYCNAKSMQFKHFKSSYNKILIIELYTQQETNPKIICLRSETTYCPSVFYRTQT